MRQILILILLATVASLCVEGARLAVRNEVQSGIDEMNRDIVKKLENWE